MLRVLHLLKDTMKTQHTPGPWHVEKACGRYELWPKDKGEPHCYVGTVQTSDDAKFIVRACNNHHALLEALQRFAAIEQSTIGKGLLDLSTVELLDAYKHARAAIAKAKGEA